MANAMTKAQLVTRLSQKADLPKKRVAALLDQLAAIAYKEAKRGFTIPGIGKLVVVNRKARIGRNPATGEPINIPAKRVLKFRISKAAKDAALGKK